MEKMNFLKSIGLALLTSVLMQACGKPEKNTTPPQKVTDFVAEPINQAVVLRWTNIGNNDVQQFEISYDDKLQVVAADKNTVRIDNLVNEQGYTFTMIVVGTNGIKSEPVQAKATPDRYVTTIEGKEFSSGTYLNEGHFLYEVFINNADYKKVLTTAVSKFIWEGSLNKQDDTTFRTTTEYYTEDHRGRTHVANMVKDYNIVLCFNNLNGDTTYYVENVYEKIEGNPKFLPGKYRSSEKCTSNTSGYNYTTYK